VPPSYAPSRVSVSVAGEDQPAVALEVSGQRAALRVRAPLELEAKVRLTLAWSDGQSTTLPGRVCSVSHSRDDGSRVAEVELQAVEGDWRAFLNYLGPGALGAA
jgi:hypothetical protein